MTEELEKRAITIGRYLLHRQIARGGMATIHIARLMGDEGFSRIVAAKRLLPEFAEDTEFVAMFMDEARIASKVHHPNVVPVLDLVTTTDEVMLVQEYVHGVPLHVLLRTAHAAGKKVPVKIAVSIAAQVLAGLQGAHTTVDEMGTPLDIVHRDVSPQNVMIAVDGSARLLDFGVAKATMAAHVTRDGTFKGKLAYSAPEQVRGRPVQSSDVYSLAVVLWELLVGHRMHGSAQGEAELVATIIGGTMPTITEALANEADWGAIDSDEWRQLSAIEPIVQKGLAARLEARYATAAEMEHELANVCTPSSSSEVAGWVRALGKDFIEDRDKIIAAEEASWRGMSQPRRTTPVPGTLPSYQRLPTEKSVETLRPVAHTSVPNMIIAVLGVLVVLLGVGVVFAMKREPTAAPAKAAPAPEPEAPPPAPVPVVATEARPEPAAQPTEAPAEERVNRAEKPRELSRRTLRVTRETAQEIPALAEERDRPADECDPPYYFEGQKKIFKPSCL